MINNDIAELQIESGGRIIPAYTPHSTSGLELFNQVCYRIPLNIDSISSIGFHRADGVNYLKDCFAIIISGYPPEYVYKNLDVRNPSDYYAYIIEEFGDAHIKIYDQEISYHKIPELPPGSILQEVSGIGVNSYHAIKDVYFKHSNRDKVIEYYKDLVGSDLFLDQDLPSEGFFAISYDSLNLEPKMLKRYVFNY